MKRTVGASLAACLFFGGLTADREPSVVDRAGVRRIVPGSVQVWVGGGQPVTRSGLEKPTGATVNFKIASAAVLPN